MNRTEVVERVMAQTGVTRSQANLALSAVVDTVVDAVAKGDSVQLVGFGTFKASHRAERQGRNPKTGEPMVIAASTQPKFTPGSAFKEAVASAK